MLRNIGGTCCLLKDKLCTSYDQRPRGCHEYPWYNVGGQLYYDKGCPGIVFDADGRPAVSKVSFIEQYIPVPALARSILTTIFRIW